jgi:ATP-dependent Clp protease ATP-binding subunit ClpA
VLSLLIRLFVVVALLGIAWLIISRQRSEKRAPDGSFTVDLTDAARRSKTLEVVGMDEVIERLLHVIARKQKNNPLLIGEPGVGKTAAVEGLAQRIVRGQVPAAFRGKRILALQLGDLMAGTKYRGELEARLRELIKKLEDAPRENILFIDELHMIEQARGSEGSLDIADILKPALSRGELQIIGATTWKEYQKYIQPDAAIDRRFQPVLVEEPSRASSIQILEGVKGSYEAFHGVCIPTKTIRAAVDASMKVIKDRFLPDKAFDLIDEACAKVALEAPHRHARALGLVHAASAHAQACRPGTPIVTPEDVNTIAHQWHAHRTHPHS